MIGRLTILFLMLSFTSACSLHRPQTLEPPVTVPETYLQAPQKPSRDPAEQPWWLAFADDTLNALLSEALAANPDLAQAVARLHQAQAVQRAARAPLLPSLDVQGQARRENSPSVFGEHTGTSYSLSLAAAYEVDLWKKIAGRAQAADFDRQAAWSDTQTLLLSLSAHIADLYYLAAEQRSQLELTDAMISAFNDIALRVEERYLHGLVPALDVYQARQNLENARARRPQFERSLAQAEHALAVLLGRYPGDLPAGALIVLPQTPDAFPAGLPSSLLTRRPDVRASLLRVQAADARIGAAIAERFPAINLLAGYGYSNTSFAINDISGTFWNLILNAAQPLFDAGRRKAEVARNEALFRERLAAYHATVLSAFQEVEDALAANRTSELRIAGLAKEAAAAAAALRLAQDRYLSGLSDYLPVLAAQSAHINSQSQLLVARRQLISDRITLARALGGTWMAKEIDNHLALSPTPGQDQP